MLLLMMVMMMLLIPVLLHGGAQAASSGKHLPPAIIILCPAQLETSVPANAPPGWELMPGKAQLNQAALYAGHPDYATRLNAQRDARGGSEWRLDHGSGSAARPGKITPWLKCEYSSPGLTLLRPLPAKLTRCHLQCQQGCQLSCS